MSDVKRSRFHREVERSYDEVTVYAPKGVNGAAMDDWSSAADESGAVVVPRYAVAALVGSHGFSATPWPAGDVNSRTAPPKPVTAEIDKRK